MLTSRLNAVEELLAILRQVLLDAGPIVSIFRITPLLFQPYLEPLYAFRGRAERAGDVEIVLFAPAVADAWRGGR